MLVLNDAQALVIENLLTKMLVKDAYSVSQLEEALGVPQRTQLSSSHCDRPASPGTDGLPAHYEQIPEELRDALCSAQEEDKLT